MSASNLHPNMYRGRRESSGYLARNTYGDTSNPNAPRWKGRVYVEAPGWYWMSGWVKTKRDSKESYLQLKLTGLSDEEAMRYCDRGGSEGHTQGSYRGQQNYRDRTEQERPENDAPPPVQQSLDDDIPF